jgi:cyanophycin synthetase
MKYDKLLTLRGPNRWGVHPAVEAWLNVESADGLPADQVQALRNRLQNLLSPSTMQGECTNHHPAAPTGLHLGQLLADLALQLQVLSGSPVRFATTSASQIPGVYKVVVEYQCEKLGRASLNAALHLLQSAALPKPVDVEAEVQQLRDLARQHAPKTSTTALLQAARERGIPARQLTANGLLALGFGHNQRRLLFTQTDRTNAAAVALCHDRQQVLFLLKLASLPVPPYEVVSSEQEAVGAAEDIGLPVLVRPCLGLNPKLTRRNLRTPAEVVAAYQELAHRKEMLLVEKQFGGLLWRLLVVGEQVVSAVLRDSARKDVTAAVHPDATRQAVEAARVLGLDVAGVDVVAPALDAPLGETGGVIVSVHPHPSLVPHLNSSVDRQPTAEAILNRVFPEGNTGRIPVVTVTGTNGKTTTTRLTAHVLGRSFAPVGMCCSEGIYLGDRLLEAGDCSGPNSARAVLYNPHARAAVLETARGGILREGLGFDQCRVAIVTNIAKGDHLGLHDVHTPQELAHVKRTIVAAVGSEGTAVLNANDPLVAAMAEHCRGHVHFFACDELHPILVHHRSTGRRVAFVRANHIVLADGSWETTLVNLAEVPLTHGGVVGFNVENCLAASAAAWSVGMDPEEIRAGLATFNSVLSQLPGRFNLMELNGATVILDYAHNISALESFLAVVRQFPHRRRTTVYAVPGDRTDEVIRAQAELLGEAYDRVILYEDSELRGRADGALFALMREGLNKGSRVRDILEVRGNLKAVEVGLSFARPGELLAIQPEFPDLVAEHFLGLGCRGISEIDYNRAVGLSSSESVAAVENRRPIVGGQGG